MGAVKFDSRLSIMVQSAYTNSKKKMETLSVIRNLPTVAKRFSKNSNESLFAYMEALEEESNINHGYAYIAYNHGSAARDYLVIRNPEVYEKALVDQFPLVAIEDVLNE